MKRKAVLDKLKAEAAAQGKQFSIVELKKHSGVIVGNHRSTLGRHSEIDEVTVGKFYKQFSDELGEGWWR